MPKRDQCNKLHDEKFGDVTKGWICSAKFMVGLPVCQSTRNYVGHKVARERRLGDENSQLLRGVAPF